MKRKVLLVTERRADYSRFKPILELLRVDDRFDYELCVTGLHLLEQHGSTINEIQSDGFKISHKFDMFTDGQDTTGSMVKSLGIAIISLSEIIELSKPDIILKRVDLPHPEGPTKTMNSPESISILKFLITLFCPKDLFMSLNDILDIF